MKRAPGRVRGTSWGSHRTQWNRSVMKSAPVFHQQNTAVQIWISGNLRSSAFEYEVLEGTVSAFRIYHVHAADPRRRTQR